MIKLLAALPLFALVASPATAAVTYDAFSTFNGTQGAGNFTYGSVNDANTTGTLFTANSNCFITGSICLQAAANHDVPGVTKSSVTSFQYDSVNVPTDRLLLHPGNTTADGGVFITFTAPVSSLYNFVASFSVQDISPSGTTEIFRQQLGGGPATFFGAGALNSPNSTYTYSGSVFLNAGDLLSTIINRAVTYNNDSTGENFTLTAVPEPATWALMVFGFGFVGATMRSGKRRRMGTTSHA